tara:strand:- start:562 stop:1455 length:894 start_codon:yes stop_codon:yes gene_type:complete
MANKDIKEVLKEGTQDLLSEDVLNEIEAVFNEAVNERVTIATEAALVQQDDDHAKKVEQLLEAVDTDHTNKLQRIVEAIDANHTEKLKKIVEYYQNAITSDAGTLKNTLVENVSNYLDLYLEKTYPTDMLDEAVKNKRAIAVLEDVRSLLGVDMALAKETIKEAVLDGKQQIQTASTQLNSVVEENKQLTGELTKAKAEILLSEKCSNLPEDKTRYIKKVLGERDEHFITENFDYTLSLFEKQKQEQLEAITNEAAQDVKGNVDPEVIEENVQPDVQAPVQDDADLYTGYMSELGKY